MALTYIQQARLAENGDFQAIVRQAMVRAAIDIMADKPANTPQAIEIHAKRTALATQILNNPTDKTRAFAFAVAANTAINTSSTDDDVQWTVNSLWNGFAGVVNEAASV